MEPAGISIRHCLFVDYVRSIDPTAEFLYIGATRGLENKIVPPTGIPFKTLEIQGFKRKLSLDNFKTVQLFLKSYREAKENTQRISTGCSDRDRGYVSGAVVYAASALKIPTIIHEQNSVPGITNKFLTRYVDKIAIAFQDAAHYFPDKKTVLVGNPRGQEVKTVRSLRSLLPMTLTLRKKLF